MTEKIKAVFIGGPADGRKMEINVRMQTVRVPVNSDVGTVDLYTMPTAPDKTAFEVVEYVVHLVDVRGYPPVAICTPGFDFDWSAAFLALMDNYNPGPKS